MVTEALSSEETTVEVAITAVSGLSSYFSAVVALAVAATAITAADVAAAAPLFVSSDEKFDDASTAQSLCGIA